jgi:hypothetical protein
MGRPISLRGLLDALEAERAALQPAPAARDASPGDLVIELAPEQCAAPCPALDDRYASAGQAIELGAGESAGARVTVPVQLAAGRWSVFVRVKSHAKGPDRLTLLFDEKRVGRKEALGNYREWLGDGAWVWASAVPGAPAFELEVRAAGDHVITLQAKGSIRLDQLWLTQSRRELPIFNDPVKS